MWPKIRQHYRTILRSYLEEMKSLYCEIDQMRKVLDTADDEDRERLSFWLKDKTERYECSALGARKIKQLIKSSKNYG